MHDIPQARRIVKGQSSTEGIPWSQSCPVCWAMTAESLFYHSLPLVRVFFLLICDAWSRSWPTHWTTMATPDAPIANDVVVDFADQYSTLVQRPALLLRVKTRDARIVAARHRSDRYDFITG